VNANLSRGYDGKLRRPVSSNIPLTQAVHRAGLHLATSFEAALHRRSDTGGDRADVVNSI
jgi:hypothetical protein